MPRLVVFSQSLVAGCFIRERLWQIKGLGALAEGCPSLKSLHVSGCKVPTNRFLVSLAKIYCSLVEELRLHERFNMTDEGIKNLVCRCHGIKIPELNKCLKVGNLGVAKVSQFCSSTLKVIYMLKDCCRVGDEPCRFTPFILLYMLVIKYIFLRKVI